MVDLKAFGLGLRCVAQVLCAYRPANDPSVERKANSPVVTYEQPHEPAGAEASNPSTG